MEHTLVATNALSRRAAVQIYDLASSSLLSPHKYPHHCFKITEFHKIMRITIKADFVNQNFSNITNEIIYEKVF